VITMRLDAEHHRQMSFAYYNIHMIVECIKTHVRKKASTALHQISRGKLTTF